MKVLLNADVDNLGVLGDVVEVKPGFARNYLLPRQLAIHVNKHNLDIMKFRKKKADAKMQLEKLSAMEQKQKLEELILQFIKKSGENDILFGSVTTSEIEEKLEELGLKTDRKKIHLAEPIKKLGNYTCKIKLFKDIDADVKIEVIKESE
jgi:large subunit ribosomal protein L9